MKKHYTPHTVFASWGDNYENCGTAVWYAYSIENAIEEHNLNFPDERVDKVEKGLCDEDHIRKELKLLSSQNKSIAKESL